MFASILEPYLENIIFSFPSSVLNDLPKPLLKDDSANLLLVGTRLSLKKNVKPVINIDKIIAGVINLYVEIPRLFNAINSAFADNLPYANNVESNTAIGKDITKKLGKLNIRTFIAVNKGKPYSTIFLITSNITPTDSEITVKAEIANSMGGNNCPINHLSINGIDSQGKIIFLLNCFVSDWFKICKRNLFN